MKLDDYQLFQVGDVVTARDNKKMYVVTDVKMFLNTWWHYYTTSVENDEILRYFYQDQLDVFVGP